MALRLHPLLLVDGLNVEYVPGELQIDGLLANGLDGPVDEPGYELAPQMRLWGSQGQGGAGVVSTLEFAEAAKIQHDVNRRGVNPRTLLVGRDVDHRRRRARRIRNILVGVLLLAVLAAGVVAWRLRQVGHQL